MCKKEFNTFQNVNFNDKEFMATINVDNECFYSDHLINDDNRLIDSMELE